MLLLIPNPVFQVVPAILCDHAFLNGAMKASFFLICVPALG
jgi:hypothetical protein